MNICLYQFELHEAIALYLKKEHNIVLDTDDIDYTSIDYQEREEVFKKHKNGRVVKNEHGYLALQNAAHIHGRNRRNTPQYY